MARTRFSDAVDLVNILTGHQAHESQKIVRLGKVRSQCDRFLQMFAYFVGDFGSIPAGLWVIMSGPERLSVKA